MTLQIELLYHISVFVGISNLWARHLIQIGKMQERYRLIFIWFYELLVLLVRQKVVQGQKVFILVAKREFTLEILLFLHLVVNWRPHFFIFVNYGDFDRHTSGNRSPYGYSFLHKVFHRIISFKQIFWSFFHLFWVENSVINCPSLFGAPRLKVLIAADDQREWNHYDQKYLNLLLSLFWNCFLVRTHF